MAEVDEAVEVVEVPEIESGYMTRFEWTLYQVYYVRCYIYFALRWLAEKVDPHGCD